MDSRSCVPSSVIGSTIEAVSSAVLDVHPNTGQETIRFLIQLSSGVTLDLLPGDVVYCDSLLGGGNEAKIHVIDGHPTITGEEILAIIKRKGLVGAPPSCDENEMPAQVALILSSGRAAMNAYRCGWEPATCRVGGGAYRVFRGELAGPPD